MATTLRADSLRPANVKLRNRLSADALAGSFTVTLQSAEGISANDFLFVGTVGGGSSEKRKVTGTSGGTLTLDAALAYVHRQNEDVTVVYADRVKFYRAADQGTGSAPPDSSFSVVGSPVVLPGDLTYAELQDATGGSGYWYKYTYYNGTTLAETLLADSAAQQGSGSGHYCSVDDVRSEAGFDHNDFVTDSAVFLYRDMAEAEIASFLTKVTSLPLPSPVPPMVGHLARMLAAGYLMLKSYGPTADTQVLHRDGQSKADWAHAEMEAVLNGKRPLLDSLGNNVSSYYGIGSYPDSAPVDDYGEALPYFSVGRRY